MKDRIQRIIARENLTASKFADLIGVQRSSISHILSGRNNPGLDFLNKILQHFPHISGDWLITGQGSMVKLGGGNAPKMPTLFDKKSESANSEPQSASIPAETVKAESTPPLPKSDISTSPTINAPQIQQEAIAPQMMPITTPSEVSVERIIVFYADKTFDTYLPR